MKKIIALLLAIGMCFMLCACGGEAETDTGDTTESQNVQTTADLEFTEADTIKIEGKKYALPMPAEKLLDDGWEMPENAMSEEREPQDGAQYFFELRKNGETKIKNPGFFNNSAIKTTIDNCDIISLVLIGAVYEESSYNNYKQCSFTLPGGITEKSTYEDVIALYGTEEAPNEGYSVSDDYDVASKDAELFEKYGFDVHVRPEDSNTNPYRYYFSFNADKTIKEVEIESLNYQSAALAAFD